jgi:hypothetical protein
MANMRNPKTLDEASDPTAILGLNQSAREGKVLGIGLCSLNPSGCYDIVKGISLHLQNTPFVRVKYSDNPAAKPREEFFFELPKVYQFLDTPPQFNTNCDTVFFTGCNVTYESMFSILDSLSTQYQFTNIRYVYQIVPPHHLESNRSKLETSLHFFENSPYQRESWISG